MKESERNAQRLMRDFQHMVRVRQALFQDLLSQYGLTLQQFHLLMFMQNRGKATVSDLGNMMLVSMPTASRMLNTLCGKGFAEKNRDESDRRLVYLELTGRGHCVLREVNDMLRDDIARVIETIPEDEVEAFLATMKKIAEGLTSTLRGDQAASGMHGEVDAGKAALQ